MAKKSYEDMTLDDWIEELKLGNSDAEVKIAEPVFMELDDYRRKRLEYFLFLRREYWRLRKDLADLETAGVYPVGTCIGYYISKCKGGSGYRYYTLKNKNRVLPGDVEGTFVKSKHIGKGGYPYWNSLLRLERTKIFEGKLEICSHFYDEMKTSRRRYLSWVRDFKTNFDNLTIRMSK